MYAQPGAHRVGMRAGVQSEATQDVHEGWSTIRGHTRCAWRLEYEPGPHILPATLGPSTHEPQMGSFDSSCCSCPVPGSILCASSLRRLDLDPLFVNALCAAHDIAPFLKLCAAYAQCMLPSVLLRAGCRQHGKGEAAPNSCEWPQGAPWHHPGKFCSKDHIKSFPCCS